MVFLYTHLYTQYLSLPVNNSTPFSFRVEHSSECTILYDPITPHSHNAMETRWPACVLLLSDILEWTQIVEVTTVYDNNHEPLICKIDYILCILNYHVQCTCLDICVIVIIHP